MANLFKIPKGKQYYNPPFLRIISAITIAYLMYYLWWRATSTLNPGALVFSWMLVLAEAFGVVSYILFAWMTQDVSPRYEHVSPRAGICVDIFIPTYNESLDILEATMIGCRSIKYPHQTYILDDGKRNEVQQLAQRLGCHYITRPTNEHAKAGNINYALSKTRGEFIVMLDADMVPQPDFLERTLGYFENEKLAFIQMPQEFYNRDSIQHDRNAYQWHEQSLFFRIIQPGKNYSDSAFWCGSPSIVRRKALEDVGGVAIETITEDIHTSVRLHSRGWSSLFIDEPLAFGIAPQTIKSFLLQRLRWAQGTMQLYRSSESPIWIPGLTFKQRLSYLSSFLAYFESFQKFMLIMTPIFIITFGIFPMQVSITAFLIRWIPYFALAILANKIGGRGVFRYLQTEKYNILKMVIFIQSTLTLFQTKSLKFKVTPKSIDKSVYVDEIRAIRSYMIILGCMAAAIIYGFLQTVAWDGATLEVEAFVIALFWAGYNAMLIYIGIWEVLRKKHERQHYRFPVDLKGELYHGESSTLTAKVRLDNLSVTGASFVLDNRMLDDRSNLLLYVYTSNQKCIILPIDKILRQFKDPLGRIHTGVTFAHTEDSREPLFEYLFVELPGRQALSIDHKSSFGNVPLIQKLFGYLSNALVPVKALKDGSE
jgi:cellulose synthase (UDP-forming)